MKTVVPDYYLDFHCIAGACRHSCCVGWEIDIDDETLTYYDSLECETGRRIRDSIDRSSPPHFRLSADERCPHLDECGLCRIITELGEDAICDICAEHPRFRSLFKGREEIGLGICCEEACRIILGAAGPMRLVLLDDDGESCCDEPAESELFREREAVFAILQDRSITIDARLENLFETYGCALPYTEAASWCELLLSLEMLDGLWGKMMSALSNSDIERLDECRTLLPAESAEQLLVYFVYRYLGGAAFDGNYVGRLRLAVLCFYLIRALFTVLQKDGDPMEELCDIARMLSSEIEYSEENLEELLIELSF